MRSRENTAPQFFLNVDVSVRKFGKNNFVEVARKVAITEDGENEFVSLSRGFYTEEGEKRYARGKNIALPADSELLKKISELLAE